MRNKLYYAIKDIKRNLGLIIVFIGQLTISVYFIFICIAFIIMNQQYGNQIKKLIDYNLVTFNPYYDNEAMRVTPRMNELLIEILDTNQNGFSFVANLGLSKYPNIDIVVGFGKFGELFDLESDKTKENENSLDTRVFIGSKVNEIDIGDKFGFGVHEKEELTVNKRLPRNTSYLHRQQPVNLEYSIVILTSFEKFIENYFNHYTEPLITNVGLLNPTDEQITEFIRVISESGMLNLIPNDFEVTASRMYQETVKNMLFFVILFACVIFFIALGIVANILMLIDSNLQEYAIHRLYGALLGDLYWRTVIYVMVILVLPLVLVPTMINKIFFMEYFSPVFTALLVGVATAIVSIVPLNKLKKQDITFYLRRDY